MTEPTSPPDISLSAGEYALGLLPEEEARAFKDRLARDPDLRAEYARWSEDLVAMAQAIPEVLPPSALRRDILAALPGAPDPVAPAPPKTIGTYLRRWFSGVGVAAMLAIAVFVVLPRQDNLAPEWLASLVSDDGAVRFDAGFDVDTNVLSLTRRAGLPLEGRAQELWLIVEGEDPLSLGLLGPDADLYLNVPPEWAAALPAGGLAISDEPTEGAPVGGPAGALLAMARFKPAE